MDTILFAGARGRGRVAGEAGARGADRRAVPEGGSGGLDAVRGTGGRGRTGGRRRIADCGADRFAGVAGEAFAPSRYATDALAAEAICREAGATLVIAAGTSRWWSDAAGRGAPPGRRAGPT